MDYTDPDSSRNVFVEQSEPVFTVLFTLEAVIKIIAMGFIVGEGSYLKDGWNWLDFLVVITGLLAFSPQMANVSALRTFRLFRPLKSLSSLPSMKILVSTLLASFKQLGEILTFASFLFLIFAILGVTLFEGKIHYRCRETPYPENQNWVAIPTDERLCGARSCPVGTCGSLLEAHD